MFCSKCGKELPDEAKFCPACGATTDGTQQTAEKTVENTVEAFTDTADTTAQFAPEDIAQNKGMAILSYLSILVLIPLFAAKDSRFARFHANQGLVLLVSEVVWSAVTGVLGRLLRAISPFLGFVTAILGWGICCFWCLPSSASSMRQTARQRNCRSSARSGC